MTFLGAGIITFVYGAIGHYAHTEVIESQALASRVCVHLRISNMQCWLVQHLAAKKVDLHQIKVSLEGMPLGQQGHEQI